MAETETVAWIRPPHPIRGLDHLSVQAPCTALFAQLLPGITNVTNRARYYAFHPWVIWSFEKRYTDHSLDAFRRVLRRAECLFALIAIRHARRLGDSDEGRHGLGMVGREKLLRIDESGNFSLDDYAGLKAPKRYFQNRLGALGQYYFGPLRDLRVLDRSPHGVGYPPCYDRERGRALAEAFASGVPEDSFFRVLEKPSVKWGDLDKLAPFCPCGLLNNPAEHDLLLDLFLARSELFGDDGGLTRRASLGLMLDLASRVPRDPGYTFERILRGAAYSGTLSDGTSWQVKPVFDRVRRGWATYQRNELLSLSVQGLFAAVLRGIQRDRSGRVVRVDDAADVAVDLLSSLSAKLALPLVDLITQVRQELPPITGWLNPAHELQRGWRLHELGLEDGRIESVAGESVAILSALLARGVDEYPYGDFDLDPEYFDPREIHLLSLRNLSRREWAKMSVREWVRWLAVHWCVGRHLRVALRKIRGEQRDTFRIRPLEGELRVVEVPQPAFTGPRVDRSIQILRDLGLLDYDDDGTVVLTTRGQEELEACRGS